MCVHFMLKSCWCKGTQKIMRLKFGTEATKNKWRVNIGGCNIIN